MTDKENPRLHKNDLARIELEIVKAGFQPKLTGGNLVIWSGNQVVGSLSWRPLIGWKPMTCSPTLHIIDDLQAWLDDLIIANTAFVEGNRAWHQFVKSNDPKDEAVYHGVHAAYLTRTATTAPLVEMAAKVMDLAIEAADLLWAIHKGKVIPDDPELRRINQEIYTVVGKLNNTEGTL